MVVKLIAHTPNPMEVIEQAACVCYKSEPTEDYRIAKACAKAGHLSVFEHASFTFKIEGVSRSLLAQLTRHRHGSFSVESQRYVGVNNFDYVTPAGLIGNSTAFDELATAAKYAGISYRILRAAGASKEDARAVLPNATCTNLVLTFNARALAEASHLRLCTRAQYEIRKLFVLMRDCVREVCPEIADMMVPACETHSIPFCEEHKGCGKHPALKDIVKEGN